MSDAIIDTDEGYRPVGKHRFVFKIVASLVGYAVVVYLLNDLFGDTVAYRLLWIGIALTWIIRSARLLITPDPEQPDRYGSRSIRSIQTENVLALICWTAIATGIAVVTWWPKS